LLFIDFGKARLFKRRTHNYWACLLREHFFIKTKLLKNEINYKLFLSYYLTHYGYGNRSLLKAMIVSTNVLLQWRDQVRRDR